MAALVTSLYGGYDDLAPLPSDHGFADAVCVTDDPGLAAAGWRVVVEPSRLHPRRAAKAAKAEPWEWTDEPDSVWIDASFDVLGPRLREAADRNLARGLLVAFAHPSGRRDAYEEAAHSVGYAKYRPERDAIAAQVEHYLGGGLPLGSGLWEVGVLARRHADRVRAHGRAWLAEMDAWSLQDQVSFPWACWRTGVAPTAWDAPSHWDCGWVRRRNHRDGT